MYETNTPTPVAVRLVSGPRAKKAAAASQRPFSVGVLLAATLLLAACSQRDTVDDFTQTAPEDVAESSTTEASAASAPAALEVTMPDGRGAEEGFDSPGTTAQPSTTADPNSIGDQRRLWIEPVLVDCEGSVAEKCMLIAEGADSPPAPYSGEIVGFSFEPGFSYVVDVSVEQSSGVYTLIAVIDKVAT